MATNTYVALDKVTIGTATNTVVFSSIPATYTDLRIVIDGTAASNSYCTVRFNGDTNNNYSNTEIVGDGSTAGSFRNANNPYAYTGSIYTTQTSNLIDIFSYANSTTFKTFLHKASNANNSVKQSSGLWRSTSAITSITIGTGGATNFNSGCTFSLYGIAAVAVSPAPKATGGAIYSDDLYYYHVFGSSGILTATQSFSADVLTVAGGGGGGGFSKGGGGGAGGLCYQTGRSLTATNYTVTVGAGGSGGGNATRGASGGNSVFDTTTANGGGGGGVEGSAGTINGISGGSGGGGSRSPGTGTGGSATQGNSGGATGYGNAGGAGVEAAPYYGGGGGGGATAAGGIITGAQGGAGGAGLLVGTSWTTATGTGVNGYYAGGGGGQVYVSGSSGAVVPGGVGGIGGGGAGGTWTEIANSYGQGANGVLSTGGGGGGGAYSIGATVYTGAGNGGSGVVIVRYLKA